jgi:hypothetical protein
VTTLALHSLWVGPQLGYLEQLCIRSAQALGHPFTLWCYAPRELVGVPAGAIVRDAAEILPQDQLVRYRANGSVALGSNIWRIELLARGLGCWVDMDLIFLHPLEAKDYLFGLERHNSINNAVLFAKSDSPLVADLRALLRADRVPPWWGPRNRLKYYWQRLRGGLVGVEDFPWGTFGPGMLTYAVRRNGLLGEAAAIDVFYPLRYENAPALFEPAEVVEQMLTPATRAVHMWHSRLAHLAKQQPPPGSYLDKMCRKFSVDADAPNMDDTLGLV